MSQINEMIEKMTLEEKASLCSGGDFWHLKGVERLGIPEIMVADGPHGLRKQDEKADHLGLHDSIQAVCFPAAAGMAASFDRGLYRRVGETLGEECQAERVAVLLGPAVNIKRSPLCGRNFEYMSEDPYLSGELAAAYIEGVQSKHIGTSIKHYAGNNQEKRRSNVSSEISERALREIYLPAFETAVKKAQPWTVMCSYNRINGEYVSQSRKLLTDILRKQWGFQGFVMTDWGACDDRIAGLLAGQDLEMPSSDGVNDRKIVEAVKRGEIEETVLDTAVRRILEKILEYAGHLDETAIFDREKHHGLAVQAACETIVLLKNETGLLPLKKNQNYVFIGEFAKKPRYQGGGSSHIHAYRVENAYEEAKKYAQVSYVEGFSWNQEKTEGQKLREAVEAAARSDAAVIFAGLSEIVESEAYDRKHMRLPECQNRLIEEVSKVQPNTVVVLQNGAPVEMPWVDSVPAIVEAYLGGEAAGRAQAEILFGEKNPCAKLAETFPVRVQDNPSWLDFGGDKDLVSYGEGIFVGYRYYDKKEMEVLFPFGHGLSYTSFTYSDLHLSHEKIRGSEKLEIEFMVTNTGDRAGKEIAQIYVEKKHTKISRATRELKGFIKTELQPGEQKRCKAELDERSFAYYAEELEGWRIEPGEYHILVGASSRDIRLSGSVIRTEEPWQGRHCDRNTTLGELRESEVIWNAYKDAMEAETGILPFGGRDASAIQEEGKRRMAEAILQDTPLRGLRSHMQGKLTEEVLQKIIDRINLAIDHMDSLEA